MVIENKEALLTFTPQVCDFFPGCNRNANGIERHLPVSKLSKQIPEWTVLLLDDHSQPSPTDPLNVHRLQFAKRK